MDFTIIALVVTTVALWGLAGDLPRTLVMSPGVLVTIVLTVVWWRLRMYRGTSPGYLLLGLRSVDSVTGLPNRLPGLHVVDIRRDQDPLHPRPRPLTLDAVAPKRPPIDVILIVFLDDGSSCQFNMPCMIGRDPRVAPPYHCLAITDISRTVSRTHLVLQGEPGLLLLNDMGNRGGIAIITAQGNHPLPADQTISFSMAPGPLAYLRLGQRELRIEALPSLPGAR